MESIRSCKDTASVSNSLPTHKFKEFSSTSTTKGNLSNKSWFLLKSDRSTEHCASNQSCPKARPKNSFHKRIYHMPMGLHRKGEVLESVSKAWAQILGLSILLSSVSSTNLFCSSAEQGQTHLEELCPSEITNTKHLAVMLELFPSPRVSAVTTLQPSFSGQGSRVSRSSFMHSSFQN